MLFAVRCPWTDGIITGLEVGFHSHRSTAYPLRTSRASQVEVGLRTGEIRSGIGSAGVGEAVAQGCSVDGTG